MKKRKVLLVLIFILAVAIAAAAVVTMVQQGKKPAGLEQLIASGPIVYVECKNIERNLNDFLNSELVRRLSAIDFLKALRQLGAPEQEIVFYQGMLDQLRSENNRKIFFTLFGQQVAVAAYRSESSAGKNVPLLEQAGSLAVVTRLKPEAQFIEALTAMLAKASPQLSERVVDYKNHQIHLLSLQGGLFELGYVKLGDFLVLGLGQKAAATAVDVWSGEREGLAQDPLLVQLQQRTLPGADKRAFFRYADFMAGIKESLTASLAKKGSTDAATLARIEESFRYAEGFTAFFFSGVYATPMHARVEVPFDIQKIPDDVKGIYAQGPGQNRSAAFVPSDAVLYSWSTMMGLPFYLKAWQREAQRGQTQTAVLSSPAGGEQKNAGMPAAGDRAVQPPNFLASVDAAGLSNLFTEELGWFFTGFQTSSMAPFPNIVIFLGARDSAQLEAFLAQSLQGKIPVPLQTEAYNGVTISYLGGIPFLKVEPAYCLTDGYLFIATQKELLKKSIDLKTAGSGGIQTNPAMGQTAYGLLDQGNGLVFIQWDQMMKALQELVHWGNHWADVQFERRQAFKKGSEQRLADVKAEMEKKQQEVDALEAKLVALQEQKAVLEAEPVEDAKAGEEVSRRQKIIAAAQKAIDRLKEEKTQLETIRNTPGQQLPPEGVQRLAEVDREMAEKTARLDELNRELAPFVAAQEKDAERTRQMDALAAQVQDSENFFGEERQALKAFEATIQELQATIAEYDRDPMPKPEVRVAILDDCIDPFLEALMNIKWFAVKTRLDPGWMTSDFYLEIK